MSVAAFNWSSERSSFIGLASPRDVLLNFGMASLCFFLSDCVKPLEEGVKPLKEEPLKEGVKPLKEEPLKEGVLPLKEEPLKEGVLPLKEEPLKEGRERRNLLTG